MPSFLPCHSIEVFLNEFWGVLRAAESSSVVAKGGVAVGILVSRLELKPWWRSYGMTEEDRAVAVSWTIE